MSTEKLVPIDEPGVSGGLRAVREWRFRPLAVALVAGAALILCALVPSQQLGVNGPGAEEVIEQAPGERPLRSVTEVIAFYRLEAKLRSSISVDKDGRILFETGRRPIASSHSKKPGEGGDD
jgi:hypothetical protein